MATDTVDATTLKLVPSPAVTQALLAWPAEDKLALAGVLRDSVSETEREENRALIHARLAELTSGKAKLHDADEVIAELRREFPEVGS